MESTEQGVLVIVVWGDNFVGWGWVGVYGNRIPLPVLLKGSTLHALSPAVSEYWHHRDVLLKSASGTKKATPKLDT